MSETRLSHTLSAANVLLFAALLPFVVAQNVSSTVTPATVVPPFPTTSETYPLEPNPWNVTRPGLDDLNFFGSLADLSCDERVFYAEGGSLNLVPWLSDTNGVELANQLYRWSEYGAQPSLEGTFAENYMLLVDLVSPDEYESECWWSAFTRINATFSTESADSFGFEFSHTIEDFEALYDRGYLRVNKTMTVRGYDDDLGSDFVTTMSVGSFLYVDVRPGSWYMPEFVWSLRNGVLSDPLCGSYSVHDCFFGPDGALPSVITGLVVVADVETETIFDNASHLRDSSKTPPRVPEIAAVVTKRLPYRAPFCVGDPQTTLY